MSWDTTTPPRAAGLAQADTLKSLAGLTAAPPAASELLAPSSMTSGLNRSPVFQVALPAPVAPSAGDPVLSAAVAAGPLVPSFSAQVWVGVSRDWAVWAASEAVPLPRLAR